MTSPIAGIGGGTAARPTDAAERLRASARDLEAVFIQQMFKAMRETVPTDGLMSGGSSEEMFTTLMDQHIAGQVPDRTPSGLAEAVYRQLRSAAGIPAETRAQLNEAAAGSAVSIRMAPTPPTQIK